MALLPIIKDPVNREKKTKWLIGKLNWVAYTLMSFFIFSVLLALWKESCDKEDKKKEIEENKKGLSDHFEKVITNNNEELLRTRQYIVDSMTQIYTKEGQRQKSRQDLAEARHKSQMDSIDASRQRKLTSTDKNRLLKRINNILKENKLPNNIPITVDRPMGNEEARVYANNVFDFLKSKGYNVITAKNSIGDGVTGVTIGNESKGFWIFYNKGEQRILIDVGLIGNRP